MNEYRKFLDTKVYWEGEGWYAPFPNCGPHHNETVYLKIEFEYETGVHRSGLVTWLEEYLLDMEE